jgi:hypothetical protein
MKRVTVMAGLTAWGFAASLSWAAEAGPPVEASAGPDANVERFLMEGTEIQGTLETPHVVYVVPWKETSSVQGDIPLRRSFGQELLEPVDRARFQREISRLSEHGKGGLLK